MSKKSKVRLCPALGREITSAECGEGRHQTIACPAECAHNPFAPINYDASLDLETKLDQRSLGAWADEIGKEKVLAVLEAGKRRDPDMGQNAAVVRGLFLRPDALGRTFAERWLAAGTPELNKDERLFFAGKTTISVVFWEVQEVRPDGLLRVIDLLEPEAGERLLMDRRGWMRATRFQVMLVFTYSMPHYERISGAAVLWPVWRGCRLTPLEALDEIVTHAGGPAASASLLERRAWLAEHIEDVYDRVEAVSRARQHDMLHCVDATQSWAEFDLPEDAFEAMDALLAVSEDVYQGQLAKEDHAIGFTDVYDWCVPRAEDDQPERRELLGVVLRKGGIWRVQATGRKKFARLRGEFLKLLSRPGQAPMREYAQDIGLQKAAKLASADEVLVPSRLRENPSEVELKSYLLMKTKGDGKPLSVEQQALRSLEQTQARWIDNRLPMLAGRTPREAAREAAGRALLVRMLKEQIHEVDEARLRGKMLPDPMETVRELGLIEIDIPTPPIRPTIN